MSPTAPMRPDPDPTVLTTQQLLREIATSRETTEAILNGVRAVVDTRLDAMDKAIVLVREMSDKLPNTIELSVRQLKEIHEEKFDSVDTRFIERDTRTDQTRADAKLALDVALQGAKVAVDAAFQAAKEAALKSEQQFTKQIDTIVLLTAAQQKAIDERTDDIKTRLLTIEGSKKGSTEVWVFAIALAGALISLIAAIAAVAALLKH